MILRRKVAQTAIALSIGFALVAGSSAVAFADDAVASSEETVTLTETITVDDTQDANSLNEEATLAPAEAPVESTAAVEESVNTTPSGDDTSSMEPVAINDTSLASTREATPEGKTSKPKPETPKCVESYTMKYTITKVGDHFKHGTMTASAKHGKDGDVVCHPYYTTATTWAYALAESQWWQMHVANNFLTITHLGTFKVNFTQVKCGQYDWYGSTVSQAAVTPPKRLNGPSNPWKEIFVSDKASGPTPHHATSTKGCKGIPEIPKPKVKYGEWQDEAWTCESTVVSQTRTVWTTTQALVFQNGEYVLVPTTVTTTEPGSRPLTAEEIEACIPQDAVASIKVGSDETCEADSTIISEISNAEWQYPFETEPGTYTNVAIADDGHRFPGNAENPNGFTSLEFPYEIRAATGYQSDDASAECYVAPPEPPKPEEPKPEAPKAEQPKPEAPKAEQPKPAPAAKASILAATGGGDIQLWMWIVMAAGAAALTGKIGAAVRRRQTAKASAE